MALHRCRACGRTWVSAFCSSGMMEIQHLFPPPAGEDPERWARERGTSLPLRC